jgi:putative transposase
LIVTTGQTWGSTENHGKLYVLISAEIREHKLAGQTLFIEPGSPWENGYIESFNGKMRDELLDREIFTTLDESKILIGQWRREYQVRPQSALGYRPTAPEATLSMVTT